MILSDTAKLPSTISIGGIEYKVVLVNTLRAEDGTKLDGHIIYGSSQIRLDEALGKQTLWQTMLHEIIHGILCQSGYSDVKEPLIDTMAFGVLGVIQSNIWNWDDGWLDFPLPTEIFIGGINYTITTLLDFKDPITGIGMDGHVSYNQCEIKIDIGLTNQIQWQTLIHEILHTILAQAGRQNEVSEEAIDAIAYGIVGVIQGNDWEVV